MDNETAWAEIVWSWRFGRRANLSNADLSNADLRGANLSNAYLRGADLRGARLSNADLRGANLSNAYLRGADLRGARLSNADLRGAYLSNAHLRGADLCYADLRGACLSNADLCHADLRGADLSNAAGIRCSSVFMAGFERDELGFIVYKRIGWTHYSAPDSWEIASASVITEVCNPCRTVECGCGVNFGTLEWCKQHYTTEKLWKCRIRYEWAAGIVVPYHTDGKARCEKLELLEVIE